MATITLHDAPSCDRMERDFVSLQMRLSALQGQAKELQTRRTQLAREIALAKARIELAPAAAEAFTYLQEKAHARAVGEFEDLLSAFVADVVPEAGRICLELGTERGAPALDISLDNGGDLEDILTGNGGALTNVVVTGLGYSALSRTANRQFMLLDEPDCWLASCHVPNFTKVLAEVANPRTDEDGSVHPGCQTLMISHNDISLMADGAHIQDLRLERDLEGFASRHGLKLVRTGTESKCAYVVWAPGPGKGQLEVRYRADGLGDEERNALTKGYPYIESIGGARPWPEDMPGIRWIEVVNLRRHVMTRLELSPGLNVLTGDINYGKSTLYFTALRAMAYGETDDKMIRHGADACTIRLGLESDVVLELVRRRKGSPKVLFRRYDAGTMVNESRQETRAGVPSFIREALRIECVDGLDIQLRSQKMPVFLLNESPSRRAQLLSVGRESGLLQTLIEKQRSKLRQDREAVKRDEAEYNEISRKLTVLGPLAGLKNLADIMAKLLEDVKVSSGRMTDTARLLGRLVPLEARVRLHDHFAAFFEQQLTPPTVKDTRPLQRVIAQLERTEGLARLPLPAEAPKAPALKETAQLAALIERLTRTQALSALANRVPAAPVAPTLVDVTALCNTGIKLRTALEQVKKLEGDEVEVLREEKTAQEALHALKDKLGTCPVCSKSFKE